MYLAVVPVYRDACIRHLIEKHGDEIEILAGEKHLEPTVTTGVSETLVARVKNVPLFGRRALLQVGGWKKTISAEVCVVDLNPRSINAWIICAIRRILGKRTLAWGHLHPRAGVGSRTAPLRVALRRLSNGTILYGYDSVIPATKELPGQPVWVAPNSLYPSGELGFDNDGERRSILYVGRIEPSKRVDLLVDSFAESGLADNGYTLNIVGSGSMLEYLQERARIFNLGDSVKFHGRVDDVQVLRTLYRRAVFSVSPGYVGLSLTQSLGFGVPVLYAADAHHAPEIELTRFGGTRSYGPTGIQSLAGAMKEWAVEIEQAPIDGTSLARQVSEYYSAEAMADGIWSSLRGEVPMLGVDGWPTKVFTNE